MCIMSQVMQSCKSYLFCADREATIVACLFITVKQIATEFLSPQNLSLRNIRQICKQDCGQNRK